MQSRARSPRRQFLAVLGVGAGLGLLTGCGFKLRGSFAYAFDSLYIDVQEAPMVGKALVRSLSQDSKLRVLTAPQDRSRAQAVLILEREQFERILTVVNASGQVRELQLRLKVTYQLQNATGKALIERKQVAQQRDVSFNESQALGKESEEALLNNDLVADLVQQLQRQLAAVRALT